MSRRFSLKRYKVPYLPRQRIEEEATLLLGEYGARRGPIAEPPIPIDEIIELHLGLTFEFKNMRDLFGWADVHGALWMDERRVGVDESLDPEVFPVKLGRYRFTLGHEAGHWRLHRPYYRQDPRQGGLFDGKLGDPSYVCRTCDAKKPVEWQADFFAANLLMPREMVAVAWQEWRGDLDPMVLDTLRDADIARTDGVGDEELMEDFCRPLAHRFEVSGQAMRIRLEELGLLLREKPITLF